MKEIKESLNKWRYSLCVHTNTRVKTNCIYRLNTVPVKIPASFVPITRLILKFICKRPRTANQNIEKEQSWRTDSTQLKNLL